MDKNEATLGIQDDSGSLEALRRMVLYARDEAGHYRQTMVPYFLDLALQEIDELLATRPAQMGGAA